MALRITAFALIALGVFAVLFLRLWFLQILQGDQYLAQADSNRVRVVRIEAPRGSIVDRNGGDGRGMLVDNRVATVVTLEAKAVPRADVATINGWGQRRGRFDVAVDRRVAQLMAPTSTRQRKRFQQQTDRQRARRLERATNEANQRLRGRRPPALSVDRDASPALRATLQQLSGPLHTPTRTLYRRAVASVVQVPYASVPLKSKGVNAGIRNYILEHPDRFPGVTVVRQYPRQYPQGALMAQVLGQVGQISETELEVKRYRGLAQGQRIGKSGLEYEYDDDLRGRDGEQRIEVDSTNTPTGKVTERRATDGSRLRLTIDTGLVKVAQAGLRGEIGRRIDPKTDKRAGGAVAAIDPRNGEVLALDSYPSLDPAVFEQISSRRFHKLTSALNGAPLVNRAIDSVYPAASTFKLVTASAGLASGAITPTSVQGGGTCASFGDPPTTYCNAGQADHGDQNVSQALTVSSDTFFYEVGWKVFPLPGAPLQTWARNYGFQRRTGIDLPGEAAGVVPDQKWREGRDVAERRCRKLEKRTNCELVAELGGSYRRGDNVNLAVGQGDLQITPLQLAVAYAGLYDDGPTRPDLRFPRPHLAMRLEQPNGSLLQTLETTPPRVVRFPAPFKQAIKQGLGAVTVDGTAATVFRGWDQRRHPILGKTGTAERCDRAGGTTCPEQAWFVGMVQDPVRPIVIVATIEDGGYGSSSAAPIVCRMLRTWYRQSPGRVPCRGDASAGKID